MSVEFGFNARVFEDALGRKWVRIHQHALGRPYSPPQDFFTQVFTEEEIEAEVHAQQVKLEDDIFIYERK